MKTSHALLLLLSFSLPFCGGVSLAEEPLSLTFGVYTSDMPTDMYRMFKPTILYLEQSLSKSLSRQVLIKLRVFKTYDAGRKALVNGEIDFVRFGPSTYILAKQENPEVSLLVMEEQEGNFQFKGVIFTRVDSGIDSLKDLKGKSFAFGDRDSTIGRYLSQMQLVQAGIYAKDLSKQEFLERHDRVVSAVLSGKFDAGAAKEGSFLKAKSQGLKQLIDFDNVTKPWVARSKLDPTIAAAIRESLLALKDKSVLDPIGEKITGFGKTEDKLYDPVRVAMESSRKFEGEPASNASTPVQNAN